MKGVRTNGFRSKMEARLAPNILKYGGRYESEKLAYVAARTYTPDFSLPNGVLIEVKGWFTPADRTKMLNVQAAHPNRVIKMILANPHKHLTPAKKLTQAQWCEKHNFEWAHNEFPLQWLKKERVN